MKLSEAQRILQEMLALGIVRYEYRESDGKEVWKLIPDEELSDETRAYAAAYLAADEQVH